MSDISTSCIYSSFLKDVKSVHIRDISSVQDGVYALGKAHMRSIPSLILISFPDAAFETVRLTDDGSLSSFEGRSPSASSFHASLLQAINGVIDYLKIIKITTSVIKLHQNMNCKHTHTHTHTQSNEFKCAWQ